MKHSHKKRHIQARIVVFVSLLVLSTVVLIALGSVRARVAFVNLANRFSGSFDRIAENTYRYNRNFPPVDMTTQTQTVPVLLYHGIGDDTSTYTVTKAQFRSQMIALKAAGFHTIDADTFMKFMKKEITLPEKAFLLTFDDGRKDSYYNADPVLAKLDFNAVMFIAAGQSLTDVSVNSSYYLDRDEVRRMSTSGRWDVGSHGMQDTGGYVPVDAAGNTGYFLSSRAWRATEGRLETAGEYRDRVTYELTQSKKEIAQVTGKSDILFSYPFGDYGTENKDTTIRAVKTIHDVVSKEYAYAFHQLSRPNNGFSANSSYDDPFLLKRIEVRSTTPVEKILATFESATDLQFVIDQIEGDVFSKLFPRWHGIWGIDPLLSDNHIVLSVTPSIPSSLVILDGTRTWKNYGFGITTTMPHADIALHARTTDLYTRAVRCLWSTGTVTIDELAVLRDEKIHFPSNLSVGQTVTLGIGVEGNEVRCYENDVVVAHAPLRTTAAVGGIGIELWNTYKEDSNVTITSLSLFDSHK